MEWRGKNKRRWMEKKIESKDREKDEEVGELQYFLSF